MNMAKEIKTWRPKGWENPFQRVNKACEKYYGGHPFDAVEETAYEAGAGAMLDALFKLAEESPTKTFTIDSREVAIHGNSTTKSIT